MTFQALHAGATIEIIHLCFEQKKVRADDVRRHHHLPASAATPLVPPNCCPCRVKICIMQNGDVDLASLTPDKPTTMWLLHMGWLQMGRGGGSSHPPSSPQTQHRTHPPEMG